MGYIYRTLSPEVINAHKYYPVILITGARQVGKSTLCQHLFPDYRYVNMEDSTTYFSAISDPKGFLESLGKKVIIDEAQRCIELFSQIQVNVDVNPEIRYILTGSSNFTLMKTSSQSLAGRIAIFTLPPLTFKELSDKDKNISTEELFFRGFYPGVVSGVRPVELFYRNYYNTYIERDIRTLLNVKNLSKFDVFMRMMAARVGTESNSSYLAGEVGVSSTTISEWISILEASYIIFPLRPYFVNITKRLTKMPKWYFYDTGLVAYLLGIETPSQLLAHPLRGAMFENMAVAELMNRRINDAREPNLFFYREKSGKEVDIIQSLPEGVNAYEVKSAKSFNQEFVTNLNYLKKILPNPPLKTTVIYDGESFPPIAVNIRGL